VRKGTGNDRKRWRRKDRGKRLVGCIGLAATVAAAGIAATPAGASGSGRIYACYSDKTHALSYSPGHACSKGSTLLSWNGQGPQGAQGAEGRPGSQGAQGARGPQGRAGAVAGYTRITSPYVLPKSTSTVVGSLKPAAAAHYAVNGLADVVMDNSLSVSCWNQAVNSTGPR
jgi:hypothetical protein